MKKKINYGLRAPNMFSFHPKQRHNIGSFKIKTLAQTADATTDLHFNTSH